MFNVRNYGGYVNKKYRRDNSFFGKNAMFVPSIFDDVTDCIFNDMMKADILIDDDKYTITLELPGVKKYDIKLHWNYDLLTVEASKEKKVHESDNYYVSEIRYGEMKRSFGFEYDIDRESVDASYENGVLTVIVSRKITKEEEKEEIIIPVK